MAKANFDGAKEAFSSIAMDEEAWLKAMDHDPDIMWAILADIYNVIRDEQERVDGKRRMGRRPMRAAGSIDELIAAVIPQQFGTDRFTEALRLLLLGKSHSQFARRVPCAPSTISRLLSGEYVPDLLMLERLARAANVPAHFFVEYRALYVGSIIERTLTQHPHLGVAAFKRLRSINHV